ncbi:hypothetical protein pdam_00019898, partial [Pocillopora damicornis]
ESGCERKSNALHPGQTVSAVVDTIPTGTMLSKSTVVALYNLLELVVRAHFIKMSSKSPTLYYFPYDGDNFMELCHDNGRVDNKNRIKRTFAEIETVIPQINKNRKRTINIRFVL